MTLLDKIMSIAADATLVLTRVGPEEAERRLNICNTCDRMDKRSVRCKVCRCYLDAKTPAEINLNPKKLRNEITHCPMGKWGDKDTANVYREMDGLLPL